MLRSFTNTLKAFEFLYSVRVFGKTDDKEVEEKYKTLEKTLSDTESRDFESVELLEKTKIVVPKKHQPNWGNTSEIVLKWIYDYNQEELFQIL